MNTAKQLSLSAAACVVATIVGLSPCRASDPDPAGVGRELPIYAATSACGPMEAEAPFNPETYGKVRGYNPLYSIKERAVVIYTRVLDDHFFDIATAVDSLAAKDERLAHPLVVVLDEKGAQRGGYTAEELGKRREEVKRLAEAHKVSRISFFISAPPAKSVAPRIGLGDSNVLVALAARKGNGPKAVVEWKTAMNSGTVGESGIREAIASIRKAMPQK